MYTDSAHHRKAVSPLISAVLLIVLVMAIATIIMSWMTSYTKDVTDEATTTSDTLVSCSGAVVDISSLYILNGSVTDNNQSFKITINNIGLVELELTEILLTNNTGDTCTFNLTGVGTTLEKGKPAKFTAMDVCPGFLDLNDRQCSDLDTVVVYTNCESARDYIRRYDDRSVFCRH